MQVETFEVISIDEQGGQIINEEVNEEALALIERLGLKGQMQLIRESEAGEEQVVTRVPYRAMTAEEGAVYRACFPETSALEKFRQSAIPLRVLQVAAHAAPMFELLEVWHPKEDRDDPLLVGVRKDPEATYRRQQFVLARWGEALVPFEELRTRARRTIATATRRKLAEVHAELHALESGFDAALDHYLLGGPDKVIHATISFAAARF